ncbi:MAG: VWA domain-containing protein [Myxococcota bacterium]
MSSLLLTSCIVSCTDVGLQLEPAPDPVTFDNLLRVRGQHCVQPDDALEFPVKVLLAVDQSASLQCTDSLDRRFQALDEALDQLLSQPSVSVGFVGFASWARSVPFTRNREEIQSLITDGGGSATDYQGALAAIAATLENDMITSPAGDRARTRYVVVFMSDGSPEPQCNAGCEDGESFGVAPGPFFVGTCDNGTDDDGDGLVDENDPNCQDPDRLDPPFSPCNFEGRNSLPIEDDEFIDFAGVCPDYNQTPQIEQRVRDIMELQEIYDVGGISLNTVLIFSPQEVVNAICSADAQNVFGFDRVEATVVMRAMSTEGQGIFRDVDVSEDATDFLEFDFRPLEAPQWLSGLIADNQHTRPTSSGVTPDTDTDGLSDEREFLVGTDRDLRDSELPSGDGYSDALEWRLSASGYDPLSTMDPPVPCLDSADQDGDELTNCEEAALETNPLLADSDNDQMTDFLEVVAGLDPLTPDAEFDLDFDGIPNREELRAGTDPSTPDEDLYRFQRQNYQVDYLGRQQLDGDERRCYDFDVDGIQMVETPVVSERGLNRVLVYAHEQPALLSGSDGFTYVACFEAFYFGETSKVPASGFIDASQEGWTQILTTLQTEVDSLIECPWFAEGFNRNRVNRISTECLAEDVVLGRFLYSASERIDLIEAYIARNLGMTLPLEAFRLFHRIEEFDPDSDCVRPWEMDRLLELFAQIKTACLCQQPPASDMMSSFVSPCCSE